MWANMKLNLRLGIAVFVAAALLVGAQSTAFAAPSATQAARASAIPPSDAGGPAGVLISNSTGDSGSASNGGSLPFTGLDLRFVVVAGAFLVLAGATLRKRARNRA
jgi:hypothetical protein